MTTTKKQHSQKDQLEFMTRERDRYLAEIDRITLTATTLLNMRVDDIMALAKKLRRVVDLHNVLVERVESLHFAATERDKGVNEWRSTFDGACVVCVGADSVPEHMREWRCWRHTAMPTALDEDGNPCGDCTFHGMRCMLHTKDNIK